jgi:hypothetical protein
MMKMMMMMVLVLLLRYEASSMLSGLVGSPLQHRVREVFTSLVITTSWESCSLAHFTYYCRAMSHLKHVTS